MEINIMQDEEKGLNVPIPNAIPEPPDLSSLPGNILRSGAVEALINQNDDLMARLSVSLRRISSLEERLSQAEQEKEKQTFLYNNLRDQLLIIQEKSRVLAERKDRSESEFQTLQEKIRLLEVQCAELYTNSKERQLEANERIQALSKRLARYLRYRQKVRQIVQPISKKLPALTTEANDLRQKLLEATQYIQEQTKRSEADQAQLVNQYEERLRELENELARMEGSNRALKARVGDLEKLYDKNTELENRLVLITRKKEELHDKLEGEIQQLQQSIVHYRTEAKTSALTVEQLTKDLQERDALVQTLETNNKGLEDQVESLQCLWKENQGQLEKQIEKTEALQKLNQQLSARLNEYRREIQELRTKLESTEITAQEKVQELKSNFETARKLLKPNDPTNENADKKIDPDLDPSLMNRIDSLIAEIQSGVSRDI